MKDINGMEMFSLREICEECVLRKDKETGQVVGEKVCFSSMEAMIDGALAFVRCFEKYHSMGKVYGDCDPGHFFFNLENGSMHFTGADLMKEEAEAVLDPEQVVYSEFLAPEIIEELDVRRQEGKAEPVRFGLAADRYFIKRIYVSLRCSFIWSYS